jgi:spectinomycin phosphotransferase
MPVTAKQGETNMLERPELRDERIAAALHEHYCLTVAGLDFLPIGNDATAWVYLVRTADEDDAYFLKVKRGMVNESSLVVPRYLKDKGIAQVVAPLPTGARRLWIDVDEYSLVLYPFIAGRTGMEVGLSASQWLELGNVLKCIHMEGPMSAFPGPVHQETFAPKWAGLVKELQTTIRRCEYNRPFARELAAYWRQRQEEITALVARTEELGWRLQAQPPPFVLCHADIHTANVLVDPDNGLHIVDWDETILAPKERDLMFMIEGAADANQGEPFFQGYGETEIDPLVLAYYRYEWVVQEIGDFGKRVFLSNVGDATKQEAVQLFKALFQPGDVVDLAEQVGCDAG